MSNRVPAFLLVALSAAIGIAACGSDDDGDSSSSNDTGTTGSPEQTGEACAAPSECYPDVADGELVGDALCLTEVRGGYCTHTCTADEDCCAAEGECETDLAQVCSPFQSTGETMCFLSCEADDVPDGMDEQEYCQHEASRDFICRSSGGGSDNRKVCVPGDCGVGAACAEDADCSGDLTCITGLHGGYCTRANCSEDADCPNDSRCVQWDEDESYCFKTCSNESDCSFCRGDDLVANCSDDVGFAEGDAETVCVPPR